ncbi:AAA family ATPase [Methylobacterium terrae]|uniref:AAA family ATPase n=1 Tax=Methylobacterium terrae TaxID=2202827 RepID=A0A2U8WLX5_9HYPH|nr:AAA family ATPase [Methylobacterium terrae]AWN47157.1 AAA family ATPase [Methylobacterium terrae]
MTGRDILYLASRQPRAARKIRFQIVEFGRTAMTQGQRHIVRGMIPSEALVTIYGAPKSGKSFFTFDLTMHVALGWAYRGRRVRQGAVVYCALEGVAGFSARVEAFRQERIAEDHGPVPFYLMTTPLVLVNDVADFIASVQAQLPDGGGPAVVVIDTLNRAYTGSENDDEDMNRFIRAAAQVQAALRCTVLVVHHSGVAGDRPRGHSSLGGAVDALLSVKKSAEGVVTVTTEWMKDGAEGEAVASRLRVVEVGRDDEGDAITSCVVDEIEGAAPSRQAPARRLSDRNRLALAALAECLLNHGREPPPALGLPSGLKAAPVERWREELHARGVIEAEDTNPRATFKRLREALTARSLIAERDGLVWSAGTP